MKTCFVSMPLGIKRDPYTGMEIDFDNIYINLIKPAILETESSIFRVDEEFLPGDDMIKTIIKSVISSDIMIADLTTQNPNVMYELGMRHMAQRGLTIMICSSGTRIPFNISNYRVISYQLNSDGSVSEDSKKSFQQLLRFSIEANLDQTVTDSPVFSLFPDVKVILPEELLTPEIRSMRTRKSTKRKIAPITSSSYMNQSVAELKEIQSDVLSDPETADPDEFVRLLKNYRDISAWEDLVEFAEHVPDNVKRIPEVRQLCALALNRLGQKEKAATLMEELITQTGGDAETFGILGRIYKDKYINFRDSNDEAKAAENLNKAIGYYKAGFEKQPSDFYTGVNVVNLLMTRNDDSSKNELNNLLPRVRDAVKNKMNSGPPDYWTIATALELSSIAGDWDSAEKEVQQVASQKAESWMLQTTLQNLKLLYEVQDDKGKHFLSNIISVLEENTRSGEGQRYANL